MWVGLTRIALINRIPVHTCQNEAKNFKGCGLRVLWEGENDAPIGFTIVYNHRHGTLRKVRSGHGSNLIGWNVASKHSLCFSSHYDISLRTIKAGYVDGHLEKMSNRTSPHTKKKSKETNHSSSSN